MSTSKKQSKKSGQASIIDQLDAKSKKQVSSWIEGIGDFLNVDKEESQAILERLFKAFLEKGNGNKRNAGRKSREEKKLRLLHEKIEELETKLFSITERLAKILNCVSNVLDENNLIHRENSWDLKELQEWEERFKGK